MKKARILLGAILLVVFISTPGKAADNAAIMKEILKLKERIEELEDVRHR
jgi:hypothetical protein